MIKLVEDVIVEANFALCLTKDGEYVPGSMRGGHNVFTLTGREYLAQVIAPFFGRNDKIFWMGVGDGSQPEVASVDRLANNIPYAAGLWLKAIQSEDFPTSPATSVAFLLEFTEDEISIAGVPAEIREIGMFTSDMIESLENQPPVAYKTFEPLNKTNQFRLSVRWEVRFR
jgi:hypothetical protein